MKLEPTDLAIGDWKLKVRQPEGPGSGPAIFLLHGWTGDERSMWIFASKLPRDALLIAPRAPYISKHSKYGGYSWVEQRVPGFSSFDSFAPARALFDDLIAELASRLGADLSRFDLMGFSQGAAFAYTYALTHSGRVGRLAALAGFLPDGCETPLERGALVDSPIFIGHGARDEMVPIAHAHHARDLLTASGADVSYCESPTRHKLGANCFSELAAFFQNQ
jgi:phospholipase/carboxylesterase